MKFEITGGPLDGTVYSFDSNEISIGRDEKDQLCLSYDRTVSRNHLQVTRKDDRFIVVDYGSEGKGSLQGSFLNGRTTEHFFRNDNRPLSPGDILYVGHLAVRIIE